MQANSTPSAVGLESTWLSVVRNLAVGGLIGFMAWGSFDGVAWLLAILVVPVMLGRAGSRWEAGLVMFAYFLAGARGLPGGAAVFFGDDVSWWLGGGCWLAACVVLTLPFVAFWARSVVRRSVGFVMAVVVCAVPPVGLVGWLSPLTVGGVLFPGMGWLGLGMTLAVLSMLAGMGVGGAWRWVGGLLLVAIVVNVLAIGVWRPVMVPSGWLGVDTHFSGLGSGGYGNSGWMLEARRRVAWVAKFADAVPAGGVRVLPETILGRYDGIARFDLSGVSEVLAARGSRVLVGAEVPAEGGRYLNALVVLGGRPGDGEMAVQGVPVPVSMWKPWAEDGAVADVWGRGAQVMVGGVRAGVVICYEQLLPWSILKVMAGRPDVLVGAANGWWARGTSILPIQREMMRAYGRLFGVGVVLAGNE